MIVFKNYNMNKSITALLLMLVIFSCGSVKNTDKVIFRNINLNKQYGAFSLGVQKSDIVHLIDSKNDQFFLKNRVFGIAKSI